MTADIAFANLLTFRSVLDRLGVPFWLDGGVVLGVHRDGDFPADDWDDIDLCAWKGAPLARIVREAKQVGFSLYHRWPRQIALVKDGCKIDLFVYERSDDTAWCHVYRQHVGIPNVVPYRFLDPLGTVLWRGSEWNTPNSLGEYLTLKYGDWRTPVHRSVYSCYDGGMLRQGWTP